MNEWTIDIKPINVKKLPRHKQWMLPQLYESNGSPYFFRLLSPGWEDTQLTTWQLAQGIRVQRGATRDNITFAETEGGAKIVKCAAKNHKDKIVKYSNRPVGSNLRLVQPHLFLCPCWNGLNLEKIYALTQNIETLRHKKLSQFQYHRNSLSPSRMHFKCECVRVVDEVFSVNSF